MGSRCLISHVSLYRCLANTTFRSPSLKRLTDRSNTTSRSPSSNICYSTNKNYARLLIQDVGAQMWPALSSLWKFYCLIKSHFVSLSFLRFLEGLFSSFRSPLNAILQILTAVAIRPWHTPVHFDSPRQEIHPKNKKRLSSFISQGKINNFYFDYFLKCLVQMAFCDNEQYSMSDVRSAANL